jgi:hypothetical protein
MRQFIALLARLITEAEWDARAKESQQRADDVRRELEAAAQTEANE